jgi:hypothetical protein
MDGRAIEALMPRMRAFLNEGRKINHTTLEPEIVGCESTDRLGRWEPRRDNPPAKVIGAKE